MNKLPLFEFLKIIHEFYLNTFNNMNDDAYCRLIMNNVEIYNDMYETSFDDGEIWMEFENWLMDI